MTNLIASPVLSTGGGQPTALPPKEVRDAREGLNEFVVILFLTAGPALGAALFLTWLGGLVWGVLASLL